MRLRWVKKKFFEVGSRVLGLLLVFQIGFGTSFVAFASPTDDVPPSQLAKLLENLPPEARRDAVTYLDAANSLESGDLPDEMKKPRNLFNLGNQAVEIVGSGVFDLNQYHIQLPKVSFTGLRVVYDERAETLVFEGLRGQNERGENGVVVARHFISGIKLVDFIKDKELIMFVDHNGGLSVIPMDYAVTNVFSSPLVVVDKLWIPPAGLANPSLKLDLKFVTPGMSPQLVQQGLSTAILPRTEDGELDIAAGDIALIAKNTSTHQETLVGIFSRSATYDKIIRGFKFLLMMQMQIFPARMKPEVVSALLQDLDTMDEKARAALGDEAVPELVRRALVNVDSLNVKQSVQQHNDRKKNSRHRMFLDRWQTEYAALAQRADINAKNQPIASTVIEEQLTVLNDYSSTWRQLYTQSDMTPASSRTKVSVSKKIQTDREWLRRVKDVSFKYLTPVVLTGAIFGYPAIYEASQTMQQIQILSWAYDNLPPVLRNAEYRYPALFGSTVALLGLWWVAVSTSWSVGKALTLISKAVENSQSKIGQALRDLAKNWGPLSPWQRITSVGMRFYGTIIYPFVRGSIAYGLRQPNAVLAINNGLNPFAKLDPGSSLGRQLELSAPLRLGVSNPFAFGERRNSTLAKQVEAQSILANRKLRIDSLSWKLALVVVSQNLKVDPATIQLAIQGKINIDDIRESFENPETRREWELIQNELATALRGVGEGVFDNDLKELNPEVLDQLAGAARSVGARLQVTGKNTKMLKYMWLKSKRGLEVTGDLLLNLGYKDSQFLRKVFTNKYVADQTEKGFVSDHIMYVLIYHLIGGRADLSQPHALAAKADSFLWTNPPHWVDATLNTYAHFFVSGSRRALVFQAVRPEVEDSYDPIEKSWVDNVSRREGLSHSFVMWMKNTLDFRVSDIGTIGLKSFKKRFTTIQAGALMGIGVRLIMVPDATLADSILGYIMFFSGSQFMFGWPWDFIDRGAHYEEERINKMKSAFSLALKDLSDGLSTSRSGESSALIRKGANKILALYGQYNPQLVLAIEKLASENGMQELAQDIKRGLSQTDGGRHLGLVLNLYSALKAGDQGQIEQVANQVRHSLRTTLDPKEVDDLEHVSAEGLLERSLETLPVYTEAHPLVNWVAVTVFGAVLTTILAIPLSVMQFDPELLNIKFVGLVTLANLAGYYVYYKALKRDGWVAKFYDVVGERWDKVAVEGDSKIKNCVRLLLPQKTKR